MDLIINIIMLMLDPALGYEPGTGPGPKNLPEQGRSLQRRHQGRSAYLVTSQGHTAGTLPVYPFLK